MSRNFGIIPQPPTRTEAAAGLSTAWLPTGRQWEARGRLPRWQAYLSIAALAIALWGTIGLCVTVVIGVLVAVS